MSVGIILRANSSLKTLGSEVLFFRKLDNGWVDRIIVMWYN